MVYLILVMVALAWGVAAVMLKSLWLGLIGVLFVAGLRWMLVRGIQESEDDEQERLEREAAEAAERQERERERD